MEEKAKRYSSVPPPELGRESVGRYDIIYPLAQGGMASVYVGRLPGLAGFEKLVAIKVIHPHLSSQSAFVDMFLDEARLAARIHHPNVGEIYEVAEDDGLFFMVGELVQGHSLRSFMKRARALGLPISQPIAGFIGAKVCSGLQAAHELRGPEGELMRLVHRDVSPRNVLISYDGFVKLIDFGVAWAKDRASQTEAGLLKGKIGYMPPEQLRGHPLDARSDVFSLGVVMYLMVTGNHPFPGATDAERMHKILNGKFVPPRKVNPGLYPAMERIILSAMANNPQDRFESASLMGQELRKFIRQTGESLGAPELSVLMHSLFASEYDEHNEKVRAFHRQFEEKERGSRAAEAAEAAALNAAPPAPALSPMEARAQDQEADPDDESSSSSEGETDTVMSALRRPRRERRLLLIVGAMLLAGAVAIAWLVGTRKPRHEEATAPATPAAATVSEAAADPPVPPREAAAAKDAKDKAALPPTRPRFVSIGLRLQPGTARVAVDGELVDIRDGRIVLPTSSDVHELKITAVGYDPERVTLVADRDKTLEIRLAKASRGQGGKRTTTSPSSDKPSNEGGLKLRGSPY